MIDKFLETIKKVLQERLKEIKKQLEEIASKSQRNQKGYDAKFPNYGRSDDENAEEVAAFEDSLSLEKNLESSLEEVELALSNISKGKYGVCETCGQKIKKKRLEILPTARDCMSCKN